jgi:uncharacterized protein (DUF1499 family)
MFCRERDILNWYNKKFTDLEEKKVRVNIKNRCMLVAYIQRLEYAQSFSGRCVSIRSKSRRAKSILVRNRRYGTQVRVILNNPRLVIVK